MEVLDVAEALYEEQIIGMLRRAEVLAGLGKEMAEVLRENGVTGNTYYRWRKKYGEWARIRSSA